MNSCQQGPEILLFRFVGPHARRCNNGFVARHVNGMMLGSGNRMHYGSSSEVVSGEPERVDGTVSNKGGRRGSYREDYTCSSSQSIADFHFGTPASTCWDMARTLFAPDTQTGFSDTPEAHGSSRLTGSLV